MFWAFRGMSRGSVGGVTKYCVTPNEKIKDFNSRFSKLLNKILDTSNHGVHVHNEWYISALASDIAIFVDRANKTTLVENMKEALVVEKRVLSLENKTA